MTLTFRRLRQIKFVGITKTILACLKENYNKTKRLKEKDENLFDVKAVKGHERDKKAGNK